MKALAVSYGTLESGASGEPVRMSQLLEGEVEAYQAEINEAAGSLGCDAFGMTLGRGVREFAGGFETRPYKGFSGTHALGCQQRGGGRLIQAR